MFRKSTIERLRDRFATATGKTAGKAGWGTGRWESNLGTVLSARLMEEARAVAFPGLPAAGFDGSLAPFKEAWRWRVFESVDLPGLAKHATAPPNASYTPVSARFVLSAGGHMCAFPL